MASLNSDPWQPVSGSTVTDAPAEVSSQGPLPHGQRQGSQQSSFGYKMKQSIGCFANIVCLLYSAAMMECLLYPGLVFHPEITTTVLSWLLKEPLCL